MYIGLRSYQLNVAHLKQRLRCSNGGFKKENESSVDHKAGNSKSELNLKIKDLFLVQKCPSTILYVLNQSVVGQAAQSLFWLVTNLELAAKFLIFYSDWMLLECRVWKSDNLFCKPTLSHIQFQDLSMLS